MKRPGTVRELLPVIVTIGISVLLVLYSYTQVDLSLTLSEASIVQTIQKAFQYVGYYHRDISLTIFLVLLGAMFVWYVYLLRSIARSALSVRTVWMMTVVMAAILVFTYPAFSYDFFNYLFTAKTVLVYQKNPYIVTPLQFTGVEPWLSFMHWTHLPTAYTPVWILFTLFPYLLGFGYLLTLIWSLKLFLAAAYLWTCYGIWEVLRSEKNPGALLGMAIFAFNPLVVIESLVSPHNDILMMGAAVWAIVLFKKVNRLGSWFALSVSVAVKLMTIFLIPAFFFGWNKKLALWGMITGLVLVLTQREILSWYWLWVMPFVALIPGQTYITVISAGVSLGLLLRYAPFIYLGHWNDPVPAIKIWVTVIPIVLSAVVAALLRFGYKSPVGRKN